MDNRITSPSPNERFIKRVVISSIALTLIVVCLILTIIAKLDDIKHYFVNYYIDQRDYVQALEINDSISDSDLRLEGKYTVAVSIYDECSYTDALQLFTELEGYRDSNEYTLKASYAIAEELYQQGLYDDALAAFALLGDYADCPDRQLQIRYEIADNTYKSGDYSQAVLLFLALGDYSDCAERAFQSALDLTGDQAVAEEMLYSGGMSTEDLESSLRIAERRSVFPVKVIDAGAYHTVLLHSDGTVTAVGDNTYGQCDVEDWCDIVTICAGAYHTVGLKSDGTVVAAGKNTHGQCNVSSWTGITAIAAADSDTYGLTADGQIKYCGYHDYTTIKRATGVSNIYAGSYAAVAELASGSYVTSHKTYSLKAEREVVDVVLNTGFIVALQADGRCISSFETVSSWESIACIDASSTAIIAADSNGIVYSHFFRKGDTVDFSAVQDACQCAAGTEHYVFLNTDGTVIALGDNSYGQCDTEALGNAS